MGVHDEHRKRVRQRFLTGGVEPFADHEALELLLFYAIPRQDTNPIAHALMDRYGSLDAVFSAPMEDLRKVKGVGESAAILLRLVPLLYQKARLEAVEQEWVLNDQECVGRYLLELFSQARNEMIYQLCLDRKGKLLACKKLGEGSAATVDLDIRKLVENALLTSATTVILAHNHPSGVALPSGSDYQTTDQVKSALDTIGVELYDHIVVSDRDYVSMRDSGYFNRFG